MSTENAPVLSTPAEHILEDSTPVAVQPSEQRLSEEQLYLQYEIKRTVSEIRHGRWKRIALQFPDDMLVDAPRVFERIRDGLRKERHEANAKLKPQVAASADDLSVKLNETNLEDGADAAKDAAGEKDETLCILADTSYGACCVDEVAAEHVDAEVVIHYGRSCLSPTARLPVIYVFTEKALNIDGAVESFKQTYPNKAEKVCLMADIPYSHHLSHLQQRLEETGYLNVFKTDIIRDPSSLLPNRTIPTEAEHDPDSLRDYSIFHVATPPTSLLLILSSRIKAMHIFSPGPNASTAPAPEATAHQLLRRRYALVTRLSTVPIFGILINTLSVANYMDALQHCQDIIARAGKKSYVFVVGKVNAAKVANFSEIGGWVVIGCWESSLIESKDFYRPIITPFELETALADDSTRTWGGKWVGDFSQLLGREQTAAVNGNAGSDGHNASDEPAASEGNWEDQPSDDEPPEFDLRTGRYVSHSRPMGRPTRTALAETSRNGASTNGGNAGTTPSSALVQRAKGDVASINGQVSPAAEYLRSKRTWQGLGSDHAIEYERDENGKIRGAAMEEGRSGVAKGYSVGDDASRT